MDLYLPVGRKFGNFYANLLFFFGIYIYNTNWHKSSQIFGQPLEREREREVRGLELVQRCRHGPIYRERGGGERGGGSMAAAAAPQ